MIYALISDVHGNLEALEAVLKHIKRNSVVDEISFLGDAVGYGANPNEVLKIIKSDCKIKIMGNHDYSALGLFDTSEFNEYARSAIDYTTSVLSKESLGILSSFQMSCAEHGMLLVHATPANPEEWNYCLSVDDAEYQFDFFEQSVCFVGHSHQPLVFAQNGQGETEQLIGDELHLSAGRKYLVNVGSVGQPRDGDPRASYVIYDTLSQKVNFYRVEYDITKAQSKMRKAELPDFLIERLAAGR